jgi:hypothetical protein
MKVNIGGVAGTRDVAIAEDNNGNKTTINNISELPIELTISAAPGANTRIDAIVAYVDNPAEGTTTDVDNPGACGIIVVAGTASSTPSVPNDSAIRTAITADGASGTTAYYVVIASVTIENGTTDITSNIISQGEKSQISWDNIDLKSRKLPVVNYPTTLPFGYGYLVYMSRIGNTVYVKSWGAFTDDIVNNRALAETIPYGYRPVVSVRGPEIRINTDKWVAWGIETDGTMTIYGNAKNGDACLYFAQWLTNDDFPE